MQYIAHCDCNAVQWAVMVPPPACQSFVRAFQLLVPVSCTEHGRCLCGGLLKGVVLWDGVKSLIAYGKVLELLMFKNSSALRLGTGDSNSSISLKCVGITYIRSIVVCLKDGKWNLWIPKFCRPRPTLTKPHPLLFFMSAHVEDCSSSYTPDVGTAVSQMRCLEVFWIKKKSIVSYRLFAHDVPRFLCFPHFDANPVPCGLWCYIVT